MNPFVPKTHERSTKKTTINMHGDQLEAEDLNWHYKFVKDQKPTGRWNDSSRVGGKQKAKVYDFALGG